jgi:hypothetical protein
VQVWLFAIPRSIYALSLEFITHEHKYMDEIYAKIHFTIVAIRLIGAITCTGCLSGVRDMRRLLVAKSRVSMEMFDLDGFGFKIPASSIRSERNSRFQAIAPGEY